MTRTKIIVLTGGVFSSLGKGLILASIGRILHTQGFAVNALKLDPYLNIDPGTMSPVQHGEIFVTYDGGECDLDLGHYERFLDYEISAVSSVTAGQVYHQVLTKERRGLFLGKTVQIVPHLTDEIHNRINKVLSVQPELDFLLIEVGGTVGDIESLPFIEALRSYKFNELYDICFIHASPLIKLSTTNETKTKPTQHSVQKLREQGIVPNILILRGTDKFENELREKIALHCDIKSTNIFYSPDVSNIYLLPQILYDQGIHTKLFEFFKLNDVRTKNDLSSWLSFTQKISDKKDNSFKIALVGKYIQLPDSYLSIIESFTLGSYQLGVNVSVDLIDATEIHNILDAQNVLVGYDGICVPYGFGSRGIEGKMYAIEYARVNKIPFLGICLGMQLATIEYARNVLNLVDANSTEFDPKTKNPLFVIKKSTHTTNRLGGTLFLGSCPVDIKDNTLAHQIYSSNQTIERYRHRYDFNVDYLDMFEKTNFIFSGINAVGSQSIIELKDHPFFVACQYHPEFKSKPMKPNPLFVGLIKALIDRKQHKS